MPRQPRIEYPGAVYHIMARGDGGRSIFDNDDDRKSFLRLMAINCGRSGWRIHAYVLMGNHFHLLLETPEPNLVDGMRWLMSVFSLGWNKRRNRHGHVFQGRYKAIPVDTESKSDGYFRIVADYIHLNPCRGGIAGESMESKLADYPWSSFPFYGRRKAPPWLTTSRVLEEFQLNPDIAGKKSYTNYLEARTKTRDALENDEAIAALRRGWALGSQGFKQRLLKAAGRKIVEYKAANFTGEPVRLHNLATAEDLAVQALTAMSAPLTADELRGRGKYLDEKAIVAHLLKSATTASNEWISNRLACGHPSNVSRHAKRIDNEPEMQKRFRKIAATTNSKD